MPDEELAVVPVHESAAVVMWGTDDPTGMTRRMTAIADAMKDAVERRGMTTEISGRKYVLAEGWSLVGAMIGVFPKPREVEEIREDGALVGFRATVELVNRDGGVVGGAVALCTISEDRWAGRDWNQIASMAQTRATAKAYRQTLGFIMPMAGYAATPAEEMDGIRPEPGNDPQPRQERRQASSPRGDGRKAAETFLNTAAERLGIDHATVFGLLDVEDIDGLMKIAAETPGEWTTLAKTVKQRLEEMPF